MFLNCSRFSAALGPFLFKAQRALSDLMRSRDEGRVLFLGVTADGRIFGYASGAEDPVSKVLDAAGLIEQPGVFLLLTPLRTGNSRSALIAALRAIHLKSWIPS